MVPVTFGEGVRLAQLAGAVLRIDFAAGKFVPVE